MGLTFACSSPSSGPGAGASGSASAKAQLAPQKMAPTTPPKPTANPNPLSLPARKLELAVGAKVFTVPEPMLRGAKLGSSFQLRATTIKALDGGNFVVDGRDSGDYTVHAAYIIPLVSIARPNLRQPVVAEFAGALRHGVVKRYAKDKIVVRFTDTLDRGERSLESEQLMPQKDGFRPGNYAVVRASAASRDPGEFQHVLLISPIGGEGADATEWLAMGYGGAAQVVKTADLVAVPTSYEPKDGAPIWVEHLGHMRAGTVKEQDKPGALTVKLERAGGAVTTGWGLVMPPVTRRP